MLSCWALQVPSPVPTAARNSPPVDVTIFIAATVTAAASDAAATGNEASAAAESDGTATDASIDDAGTSNVTPPSIALINTEPTSDAVETEDGANPSATGTNNTTTPGASADVNSTTTAAGATVTETTSSAVEATTLATTALEARPSSDGEAANTLSPLSTETGTTQSGPTRTRHHSGGSIHGKMHTLLYMLGSLLRSGFFSAVDFIH